MKHLLVASLMLFSVAACSGDNHECSGPSCPSASHTLSVATNPAAGGSVTVTPSGTTFTSGTAVSLTASPASGYQFSEWRGAVGGSTNPASLIMNGNESITAVFTANQAQLGPYTLTVSTTPAHCGSIKRDPDLGAYPAGTMVTLTAVATCTIIPFTGWTGDVADTANPFSFAMDGNKTVTGVYQAEFGGPYGKK